MYAFVKTYISCMVDSIAGKKIGQQLLHAHTKCG